MRALLALAEKDLRLLSRDRGALFWVLAYPILSALLFGSLFGGFTRRGKDGAADAPAAFPVVLVDEEGSTDSKDFAAAIERSHALAVRRAASRDEARRIVLDGTAAGYVVLVSGFQGASFLGGTTPQAEVGVAPTRRAEGGMLRGVVLETAGRRIHDAFAGAGSGGPGGGAASEWEPVHVATVDVSSPRAENAVLRPASAWEISFPSSILWGLLGAAATFASSVVVERTSGTWVRLRTAPVSRAGVLASKALACFATCVSTSSLLLVAAVTVFGVRVANPLGLVLGVVSAAVCFVGLMMLFSVSARTERAVAGISWGVLVMMAMFGGGTVPLFLMPPWMQSLASVSPVKWGILAIEGAIWRDFALADFALPCCVLLGVGAASFATGVAILRRQEG